MGEVMRVVVVVEGSIVVVKGGGSFVVAAVACVGVDNAEGITANLC